MVRIASFNVENLFARPKAFNTQNWSIGAPVLKAYSEANEFFGHQVYSASIKDKIRRRLVKLDIYRKNDQGAVRRIRIQDPKWAWLRKNRGKFDIQPRDKTKNVRIIASGRDDWIGWVELAKESTNEESTRMTAKVISDLNADILGVIEAEDRPSLVRFNDDLLGKLYGHVMLVDGNDERGIDVGILAREEFEIQSVRPNVDTRDTHGIVFSRDCPEYELRTPIGTIVYLLINHFKSQFGGGGKKRRRQADEVRRIVDRLVGQGQHVIVMGDLNEGLTSQGANSPNFDALFKSSPLVDCYQLLPAFNVGERQGTYNSCTARNRLDYILISQSLKSKFIGGGVFRRGLRGRTVGLPLWDVYPQISDASEQASDHAAVFIDLDI